MSDDDKDKAIKEAQWATLEIAAMIAENHHINYTGSARSIIKKAGDEIAAALRRMIHDHGTTDGAPLQ